MSTKAKQELQAAIKAGYCLFYCQTYEAVKAAEQIVDYVAELDGYAPTVWDFNYAPDPDEALENFDQAMAKTVLIAKNLNWFMNDKLEGFNKQMVSLIQAKVGRWSSGDRRKVLIIVSDAPFADAIPEPLQKDFLQVNFELPDMDEIKQQYDFIIESVKASRPDFQAPDEQTEQDILLSCRGMTAREIQNALAYSLVQDKGVLSPKTVSGIRAKGIERVAGVKMKEPEAGFDSLLGLDNIKEFALSTARHPLSKGILLLGPPGTGKTAFSRALGFESKLSLFEMEMAQMFGSLVGATEANINSALEIVKANSPNLLHIDELEKALSGMKGGGETDGGTTKRAMAQFLKFLSEDREGVYVVATCNDITGLPPEWIRAERWDAVFFIDLPNYEERSAILDYYKQIYLVEGWLENSEGYSGAELRSVCRIAAMMGTDIQSASRFVVPVSKTMGQEIEALRNWAKTRTIAASTEVPIQQGGGTLRSIALN